jgi:hypothetical protein
MHHSTLSLSQLPVFPGCQLAVGSYLIFPHVTAVNDCGSNHKATVLLLPINAFQNHKLKVFRERERLT